MRKALLIGINEYSFGRLNYSVSDATEMDELLSKNFDGGLNFHTKLVLNQDATRQNIMSGLDELFSDDSVDTALFYFSGHGFDDDFDGSIVTIDATDYSPGIRMTDILQFVLKSKIHNKIIILDCCFSGHFGLAGLIGDMSMLPSGTTILTSSKKKQVSYEVNGHGVFTNLLIEALRGGASDILGRVTPATIYSYIDQALNAWDQRPLFKTNVSRFSMLRQCPYKVDPNIIRKLPTYFTNVSDSFPLDPSFEWTNVENGEHYNLPPYAKPENTAIFRELQDLNRNGLLEPIRVKDMYFAAMKSSGCKLTPLGMHYWNLAKRNLI